MNRLPTIAELLERSKALNERCALLNERCALLAEDTRSSVRETCAIDQKDHAEKAAREDEEDRLRVLRARARQARIARAWRNPAPPLLALVHSDGALFPRARSEAALFLVEGRQGGAHP